MAQLRLPHPQVQNLLNLAHRDFHSHYHRERDPVSWPHRFKDPRDQEVAAFFAAILAYGNVTSILSSLQKLFDVLGKSPTQGLFQPDLISRLSAFKHRFTKGIDLAIISYRLRAILEKHGSLEKFFLLGSSHNMRHTLSSFCERLDAIPLPIKLQRHAKDRSRNIQYLVSSPARGSSCKRLNLFLRWVVRPNDGIDLGVWNSISPATLMLPIDTHVLKIIQDLGWTRSKSATWLTTEAATAELRNFCPEDPIRYDFSLCHLSMSGFSVSSFLKSPLWEKKIDFSSETRRTKKMPGGGHEMAVEDIL